MLPGRFVHSLHTSILRAGEVRGVIVYQVDRIRDGNGFTTQRVVAVYAGEAIFSLAASFQLDEPGLDRRGAMRVRAMWFHRPLRMDDWLLFDIESLSASGARGLVRGRFLDRQRRLVASAVPEGLIRRRSA